MKKRILALFVASVMSFSALLTGCGAKTETPSGTEKTSQNEAAAKASKIAMVTDTGGVNDKSFNQSAWEGMQRAEKELGMKASYIESKQEADFSPNLETLYDAKNDLIWGIGFMMADAVKSAAETNKDAKYAIVDFSYDEKTPSNVIGVVFKAEQPSFLVGYIAGKMSKTGKVGFVGGVKGVVIDGFDYGFRAGVKYANKDAQVLVQYADSFNDSAKGKAIANQMYQNGADIIFHAAGGVGLGVIESAKENKKYVIGVDRDQNNLAPDNVITSAVKRVDNGIYNVTKELKEGTLKMGTTISYGLKEGGVDIAPTSDKHVPANILEEVKKLKQDIIDGKINVPFNEKTYNEYAATLK